MDILAKIYKILLSLLNDATARVSILYPTLEPIEYLAIGLTIALFLVILWGFRQISKSYMPK